MSGQTMGIDNSTLAMGAAVIGVGGLATGAYGNSQRPARRKPMSQRPVEDKFAVYGGVCCMIILLAVGGALYGVGKKLEGSAKLMDPAADFSTGECTITNVAATKKDVEETYDCNCQSSYSGSHSSFSSYGSYSHYTCQTCTRESCQLDWAYSFKQKDFAESPTYAGEEESQTRATTCALTYVESKFQQGANTPCWIAKSPSTLPKREGATDTTGYTCPNPECAKIQSSPTSEKEAQESKGKIFVTVGNVLLPLGGACAALVFAYFYCSGKVNEYLDDERFQL